MVQVSDLLSISREKLAFFVHATSSPLASIVPVSSWVGYEVGLINDELKKLGSDADAFVILLKTIVSRFYPIFMIVLLIALNLLKRDFGPMLRAERRAFHEGKVAPDMTVSTSKPSGFRIGDKLKSAFRRIIGIFKKHSDNQANALVEEKTLRPSMTEHELRAMENALPESDTICTEAVFENVVRPVKDKPRRWYNAVVPIFIHVLLVVLGIFLTGYYTTKELKLLGEEVEFDAATLAGNGDSYGALIYAAVFSSIFSIIFYKVQSILTVSDSLAHWTFGVKDIFEPVLILIMAWSIGSALNEIRAAHFIAGILNGSLHPGLLPTVVFLTACIISFVTGTSWGTMAILFPLAVPLASAVRPDNEEIIVETIASILSGSIFGDQCSLISGTSVISALASKCPLAAHVTTQLPYALVVAFISVLCGYLPVGYGLYPPGVAILIGTIFIFAFVFIFGSKVEEVKDEKESSLLGRIRNGMSSLRKLFGDKK
jgi:Na+/H+ antiporter NhaC